MNHFDASIGVHFCCFSKMAKVQRNSYFLFALFLVRFVVIKLCVTSGALVSVDCLVFLHRENVGLFKYISENISFCYTSTNYAILNNNKRILEQI